MRHTQMKINYDLRMPSYDLYEFYKFELYFGHYYVIIFVPFLRWNLNLQTFFLGISSDDDQLIEYQKSTVLVIYRTGLH